MLVLRRWLGARLGAAYKGALSDAFVSSFRSTIIPLTRARATKRAQASSADSALNLVPQPTLALGFYDGGTLRCAGESGCSALRGLALRERRPTLAGSPAHLGHLRPPAGTALTTPSASSCARGLVGWVVERGERGCLELVSSIQGGATICSD